MGENRPWLSRVETLRGISPDLFLTVFYSIAIHIVLLFPSLRQHSFVRMSVFLFLVIVPGYAVVSALFPRRSPSSGRPPDHENRIGFLLVREGRLDGIERFILSFGFSITVVPLTGLLLTFVGIPLQLMVLVLCISAGTILSACVAVVRRGNVPAKDRYEPSIQAVKTPLERGLSLFQASRESIRRVLLPLLVIATAITLLYFVVVPPVGEPFTGFYVLSTNGSGQSITGGSPAELKRGGSQEVRLKVHNQEQKRANYTLIVVLQRIQNNSSGLSDQERRLDTLKFSVPQSESWTHDYRLNSAISGSPHRVAFLLYKETPPTDPSINNAYREVHLWVDVDANESHIEDYPRLDARG